MRSKLLFLFCILSILHLQLFARTITDMSETNVEVPQNIERVFGSAPPTTFLVALYDPKLLAGLNFPAYNKNNYGSTKYLGEHFMSLPILGGWHGNQKGASIEKLLSVKAQIILAWQNDFLLKQVQSSLQKVNIPIVMIEADKLEKTPQTFRFLGELFNMPQRGEALAFYAEETLEEIAKMTHNIPTKKQVSFYYAQGANGLQSDCSNSFHTTQFRYINANNIYECAQKNIMGMESLNFETIFKANPDFIIVQSAKFYKDIFISAQWKMLDAVKNKRVYLVPKTPFNWIDRPPSFMRLLGIHWLSAVMYPDYYKKDIKEEIQKFYELFFNTKLTDDEFAQITKGAF